MTERGNKIAVMSGFAIIGLLFGVALLLGGCRAPDHTQVAYLAPKPAGLNYVWVTDTLMRPDPVYDPCLFRWTFAKGIKPMPSPNFILKRNGDGTTTAWAACNPKFRRHS